MLRPITRLEQYLAKIAGVAVSAPAPVTRLEQYLAKIAGVTGETPQPITRMEQYLAMIADGGGGGYDGAPHKKATFTTDARGFSANIGNGVRCVIFVVGGLPSDYTELSGRVLLGGIVTLNNEGGVVSSVTALSTVDNTNNFVSYTSSSSGGHSITYSDGVLTVANTSRWIIPAGCVVDLYWR